MAATIQNLTMSGIITRDVATLGVPTPPEERFQAFLKSFEHSEVKEIPAQTVGNSSQSHDMRTPRVNSLQHNGTEMSSADVKSKPSAIAVGNETVSNSKSHLAVKSMSGKSISGGGEEVGEGGHVSEASQPLSVSPGLSRSSRASLNDTDQAASSARPSQSEDATLDQIKERADRGSPGLGAPPDLSGSVVSNNKTTIAETGSPQPASVGAVASGLGQSLSPASSDATEDLGAKMEPSLQNSIVSSDLSPEIGNAMGDISLAAPAECLPEASTQLEPDPGKEIGSAPVVDPNDPEAAAPEAAQRTGLRALISGAGDTVETRVEQDLGEGHRLVIHMGPTSENGKQSLKVHATDLGMNASLADRLDDLRAVVQNAAGVTHLTDHAAETISSDIELAVMETPIWLNRSVGSLPASSEVENAGSDAKSPSKSIFVSLLDVIA